MCIVQLSDVAVDVDAATTAAPVHSHPNIPPRPVIKETEPIIFFADDFVMSAQAFAREPESWSEYEILMCIFHHLTLTRRLRLAGVLEDRLTLDGYVHSCMYCVYGIDYGSDMNAVYESLDDIPPDPDQILPYMQIDVVCNHLNLWGNRGNPDPVVHNCSQWNKKLT